MKAIGILILITKLVLLGCNQNTDSIKKDKTENFKATQDTKNRDEIQDLIKKVLNWSHSENTIDILPVLADSKDSIYIGFDLEKHGNNLNILRKTNFFSSEFIDNYDQIILTLNKKIINKEFCGWLVGDLPPFFFANDINPWCLCQDVPYDNPNPWNQIEVEIIKLNNENGELIWKWGKLDINSGPGWKEFSYRFKVLKEDEKWKISYLQGFDFNESSR